MNLCFYTVLVYFKQTNHLYWLESMNKIDEINIENCHGGHLTDLRQNHMILLNPTRSSWWCSGTGISNNGYIASSPEAWKWHDQPGVIRGWRHAPELLNTMADFMRHCHFGQVMIGFVEMLDLSLCLVPVQTFKLHYRHVGIMRVGIYHHVSPVDKDLWDSRHFVLYLHLIKKHTTCLKEGVPEVWQFQ